MGWPLNIRDILSICAAVLSMGTVFFLMDREMQDEDGDGRPDGIPPLEVQAKTIGGSQDPLLGIDFTVESREKNFVAFGMDPSMTARTVKRIKRLSTKDNKEKLRKILSAKGNDQARLQESICGTTNDQRPRYGALQYLVETKSNGDRMVKEIRSMQGVLRPEDWATTSRWWEVYQKVELIGELREDDATIMGLAAILFQQEDKVIESIEPWGMPGSGEWDWEAVNDEYGAREAVSDYVALFHLVAELAHEKDGICSE